MGKDYMAKMGIGPKPAAPIGDMQDPKMRKKSLMSLWTAKSKGKTPPPAM